jgi:hypothetical protein
MMQVHLLLIKVVWDMAHTSISVNSSGDLILNVATTTGGYYAVTKTRDGFAVAGYYTYGENLVGIILAGAETPEATYMSGINGGNTTAMTYNDATVYYNFYLYDLYGKIFDLEKTEASKGVAYYLGYYETHPEDMSTIATTLLDYYYSGDDVIKKASKDFQNGFALGLASGGVVEIIDTTEMDALEDLIDNSGVLEDTEATVTEKVEELIMKANSIKGFEWGIKTARILFQGANQFPTKAEINLPYAKDVYQAFAYWNKEPIPIVEELTVNAPSITTNDSQRCMGQMFHYNSGVKKVILNMPDESQYMDNTFSNTPNLEEVVLNFSTKNIISYSGAFLYSGVKRIIGVLDFSSATKPSMFYCCYKLEEVAFAPNTLSLSIALGQSSNLTSESVQSIIDGLATVETAQTLTLHKNIVLTDEQKATINAKGWTLAQ